MASPLYSTRSVRDSSRQEEIRRIRKKLKLTQIEAGRLVGVGKIAFSRYERGETQAPAAAASVRPG